MINSVPDDWTDQKFIKREDPIYIHFVLDNDDKLAKTTPTLKYEFPDGEIREESFGVEVAPGEKEWVGWESGLYIDPKKGEVGTMRVWIYDSTTGRLIGMDSVEITK